MCCDCSTSSNCYEPVGHVVTGGVDLTIMDAKIRSLVTKGPSFREQNCTVNERLCREAVAEY